MAYLIDTLCVFLWAFRYYVIALAILEIGVLVILHLNKEPKIYKIGK